MVDTNVRRWLLRRFGGPDEPRRLQALADPLAATDRPSEVGAWTHASMEFGAAVCRARVPRCADCPIRSGCPSRLAPARVPVPVQPTLRGSDRSYRGEIVRRLAAAASHAVGERVLRRAMARDAERIGPPLDEPAWERVMAGLERDGLAHRASGQVRLGAATIRP